MKSEQLNYKKRYAERLCMAIAAAKVRTGTSQRKIANQVGIATGTLSHYCNAKSLPDIEVAFKIAEVVNKPMEWFR